MWLIAMVLITTGCVRPRVSTPVTMSCQSIGMKQVTTPSPRVEIRSAGFSFLPPQGNGWCGRTEPGVITFNTHPLMGKTLTTMPSDTEILHSFGVMIFMSQVPKGVTVGTAQDMFSFVERTYLRPEPRFRTVESSFASDSSLGADCIRFHAVMEERDNPRAPGAVLEGVIGDSFACVLPNSPEPRVLVISPSERYVQGTVTGPRLMDTLRSVWEPSVRSVQFTPRP
jgi:hypothetical protein